MLISEADWVAQAREEIASLQARLDNLTEENQRLSALLEAKERQITNLCKSGDRAVYLLKVVQRFIEENPIGEYLIHFDDAECDGGALQMDCEAAAEMLGEDIAAARHKKVHRPVGGRE